MRNLLILVAVLVVIWLYVRKPQATAEQAPTLQPRQGNEPSVAVPVPVNPSQAFPISVRLTPAQINVDKPESYWQELKRKYPWIIGKM